MGSKYYFGIEEIVSNSFIELNKIDNIRQIPLLVMEKYGNEVVKYLRANDDEAFMILSRYNTDYFEQVYSEYFYIEDSIVFLRDNISIVDLIDKFRGYISISLLEAFINNDVVYNGLYLNYSKYLEDKSDSIKKNRRVKAK